LYDWTDCATVHGASTVYGHTPWVMDLPETLDHLRTVLGANAFDDCVATGAAMEPGDAVQYARHQI
jgi:hypothetical protein